MKVPIFQHVPFEEPGAIYGWAVDRGHEVMRLCLWEETIPFQLGDHDVLVVLGGPMSANDEDLYPWLRLEKDFIRAMIRAEKPVLGICLGAQLIANVLGAKVYPATHKEIGWFIANTLQAASGSFMRDFPPQFTPLHWHGETFDLPGGGNSTRGNENMPKSSLSVC